MEGWEEDLDVDDSDLPSLRPSQAGGLVQSIALSQISPLRRCSQVPVSSPTRSPDPPPQPPPAADREGETVELAEAAAFAPRRRIPGPAGAVQAAMHRQAAVVQDRGDLLLEEERERGRPRGDEGEEEVDEDFVQNPWLCALDFLDEDRCPLEHSNCSIKALGSTDRAVKLVGIVKSCKPNGLGDLFVTLKDPTGTIGASVHRKVLTDGNFGGDLSVGCVVILKQVAVFSPSRSTRYANITSNNVVKIFGKDSGPPGRRILPPSSIRSPTSVDPQRAPPAPPKGSSQILSWEASRSTASKRAADGQAGRPYGMPTRVEASEEAAGSGGACAERATRSPSPSPKRRTVGAGGGSGGGTAVNPGEGMVAKVAVAQWTEEELSLLFSDDQDDDAAGLF